MKVVCYAFKNDEGKLEAPFLEYLKKYSVDSEDSKKKKYIKSKQATNINEHLKYLSDNEGIYNLPPIVQRYRSRNIGILKIKESIKLVRIAFFTKKADKIIILNAIDKPNLYEKSKKLKVDKMIKKFLDQSEIYLHDYLKNNLSLPLKLKPYES